MFNATHQNLKNYKILSIVNIIKSIALYSKTKSHLRNLKKQLLREENNLTLSGNIVSLAKLLSLKCNSCYIKIQT